MKRAILIATAVFAIGASGAIYAQQAGEYDGRTADGNAVVIQVDVDPQNDTYEVTGVSFDFALYCEKSRDIVALSWSEGFPDGFDITKGKFAWAATDPDAYVVFSMKFKGKNSVVGEVANYHSMLNPASSYDTPPAKAQICTSDQPFKARFVGAPAVHLPEAGTVTTRHPNASTLPALSHR